MRRRKGRRKKKSDLVDVDQVSIDKNEFEDDPISLLLAAMVYIRS
jgi:hypothetical protein